MAQVKGDFVFCYHYSTLSFFLLSCRIDEDSGIIYIPPIKGEFSLGEPNYGFTFVGSEIPTLSIFKGLSYNDTDFLGYLLVDVNTSYVNKMLIDGSLDSVVHYTISLKNLNPLEFKNLANVVGLAQQVRTVDYESVLYIDRYTL